MVDVYGRWEYEQNTPERKKCDYDRIAYEIIKSKYAVKTSIENLVGNIILHFDSPENYVGDGYGDHFTIDGCMEYVRDSGGFKEFDYEA